MTGDHHGRTARRARRATLLVTAADEILGTHSCEHVLTAGALEITGPADRKMVINALNCGPKIVMANFEDSKTPAFGNLITGQLNLRNASRRRYRRCLPDYAASKMLRGTVSDLIAARIWSAAVEMMDTLTLQTAEPPSGAVIRPAPSRSWSSSCTARRS
jgi:hypothetical protein